MATRSDHIVDRVWFQTLRQSYQSIVNVGISSSRNQSDRCTSVQTVRLRTGEDRSTIYNRLTLSILYRLCCSGQSINSESVETRRSQLCRLLLRTRFTSSNVWIQFRIDSIITLTTDLVVLQDISWGVIRIRNFLSFTIQIDTSRTRRFLRCQNVNTVVWRLNGVVEINSLGRNNIGNKSVLILEESESLVSDSIQSGVTEVRVRVGDRDVSTRLN